MKAVNRGDVPAPYAPPGSGKTVSDPSEDLVFDAGSLSFVQDWVEGANGQEGAEDLEPERVDARQSNSNRRLGVGAQPKKVKDERVEPSTLEKKLLRKRQRQEKSDAIAGAMDTHGMADDDQEGEGESKTAAFHGRGQEPIQPAEGTPEASHAAVGRTDTLSEGADSRVDQQHNDGAEAQAETQGRKRKARRKKSKASVAGEKEGGASADTASTPASTAGADIVEGEQMEEDPEEDDGKAEEPKEGTKKQRRGWGKAKATPSVPADVEPGGVEKRVRRGKSRSRQKNIRKDKRPIDERPVHLRAGNPEFSGRGLTDETRQVLGLPQRDADDAPPAGWGKPGKVAKSPARTDTKPHRIPKRKDMGMNGEGKRVKKKVKPGKAVVSENQSSAVVNQTSAGRKSKYKNLNLPAGKLENDSTDSSRKGAGGRRAQPSGKSKRKNVKLPANSRNAAGESREEKPKAEGGQKDGATVD